jgi:hypothetical protein
MVRDLPPSAGAIIKYQHYLFFPILCFARLVWAQQSASHAFMLSQHSWRGVLETTLIGLHYAIFLGMPLVTLPVAKALAFLALSQVLLPGPSLRCRRQEQLLWSMHQAYRRRFRGMRSCSLPYCCRLLCVCNRVNLSALSWYLLQLQCQILLFSVDLLQLCDPIYSPCVLF